MEEEEAGAVVVREEVVEAEAGTIQVEVILPKIARVLLPLMI